ncbi:MAG TPA: hypothetical protein DCP61_04710 [Treponema sp.]|nr:hypothetical protein [Treponema sp.]
MAVITPKAQRIIDWRESMATMDEVMFFDIMRMYLGEIKTPYNKQKLIEDLSSFLRKKENRETLVSLLGSGDLKILTIVKTVRDCTVSKILSFMETKSQGKRFPNDLNEHITNLQERLILFSFADKDSGAMELRINPLLEDELDPLLQTDFLFSDSEKAVPQDEKPNSPVQKGEGESASLLFKAPCTLSPQFLASFCSFAISHPDLCKNDGSLKKHSLTEMQEVFEGLGKSCLEKLTAAFMNLSIFCALEKGISVDLDRLENFAAMEEKAQYLYLVTASVAHFPRKTMQVNAQIFFCTLYAIPASGCTLVQLTQLFLLEKEKVAGETSSRFGRILSSAASGSAATSPSLASGGESSLPPELTDGNLVKALAEAALEFSILCVCGKDLEGNPLYKRSSFFDEEKNANVANTKVLSIDSAFSVTLLPGLNLHELLPFVHFMQIKHYDTAAVFEINRACAIRAFDAGFTPEKISLLLEKYSSYKIQQNIQISLEEWFSSYKSASLYKGYVLKVKEENAQFIKNNPLLSPYIMEELSAGVFFLSFADDAKAQSIIAKSGLDFIGNMKLAPGQNRTLAFLPLDEPEKKIESKEKKAPVHKVDKEKQKAILDELKSELDGMNLPQDQKEGLLDRINRRIVLNKSQLVGESVRFEKVEAGGMDYTGKIHVIESAIQNGGILEVALDSGNSVAGRPVELNKKAPNAQLILELSSSGEKICIPVSSAVRIKKTRRLLNLD